MDSEPLPYILFITFLFLSAFFSGAEVALFSLNRLTLNRFNREKSLSKRTILKLMKKPDIVLSNILIGNTVVNITLTFLGTPLILNFFEHFGVFSDVLGIFAAIIILTVIILLFGEIIPKAIALNSRESISLLVALPLRYFSILIWPVRALIFMILGLFIRDINKEKISQEITLRDINSLIDLSHKKGVIDKEEKFFLSNFLNLLNVSLTDIMTPRDKIRYISTQDPLKEIVRKVKDQELHKFLVFDEKKDNFTGMVYKKHILFHAVRYKKKFKLSPLIQPIIYVPGSKKVTELLFEMQKKRMKIALIVNEYGGPDGIVTLDDILNMIFGKFIESADIKRFVRKGQESTFIVNAEMKLDSFNRAFAQSFSSEEYETIGGFLLEKFGRIPRLNDRIRIEGILFRIRKIRNHKIEEILCGK